MVNKTLLVSLSFFTSVWWITVNMLVISIVEMCFRVGLNKSTLFLGKKVYLLYINYCTNYIHSLLQHIHS